jgi:hypothetical protein
MAAEGGEAEIQQKEETKRHTYPLVRVKIILNLSFFKLTNKSLDK